MIALLLALIFGQAAIGDVSPAAPGEAIIVVFVHDNALCGEPAYLVSAAACGGKASKLTTDASWLTSRAKRIIEVEKVKGIDACKIAAQVNDSYIGVPQSFMVKAEKCAKPPAPCDCSKASLAYVIKIEEK